MVCEQRVQFSLKRLRVGGECRGFSLCKYGQGSQQEYDDRQASLSYPSCTHSIRLSEGVSRNQAVSLGVCGLDELQASFQKRCSGTGSVRVASLLVFLQTSLDYS